MINRAGGRYDLQRRRGPRPAGRDPARPDRALQGPARPSGVVLRRGAHGRRDRPEAPRPRSGDHHRRRPHRRHRAAAQRRRPGRAAARRLRRAARRRADRAPVRQHRHGHRPGRTPSRPARRSSRPSTGSCPPRPARSAIRRSPRSATSRSWSTTRTRSTAPSGRSATASARTASSTRARSPAARTSARSPPPCGVPICYWIFGGTDPGTFETALKAGTADRDIPSNHSAEFAPVIDPTLGTGITAMVTAALTWLHMAPTSRAPGSLRRHDPGW